MCLKYNHNYPADCPLCDCVSRQRIMDATVHHTFMIDCNTGQCISFTGYPIKQRSAQPARAPPTRNLMRNCLTNCVAEERADLEQSPASGDGSVAEDSCVKRKVAKDSASEVALQGKPEGQRSLLRSLQEFLKSYAWRLFACVRSHRPANKP